MSEIEYFYSAHSAFAYLGSTRLSQIASHAGAPVRHRPFDLSRTMKATGALTFRERTPAHRAYFFGREIERWSELRDAPVIGYRPTHHDNDTSLSNCLLIAAAERNDDVDALAHAFLQSHWRDDADLANRETLTQLIRGQGIEPQELFDAAASDNVVQIYEQNTAEAITRSVFGSPTYFVDGDMFYGQDRLELVERALEKPFSGRWPSA